MVFKDCAHQMRTRGLIALLAIVCVMTMSAGCSSRSRGLSARLGWAQDAPDGRAEFRRVTGDDLWHDRAYVLSDRTAEALITKDFVFVIRVEFSSRWGDMEETWFIENKGEAFLIVVSPTGLHQKRKPSFNKLAVRVRSIPPETARKARAAMLDAGALSLRDVPPTLVQGNVRYMVSVATPEGSNQFICDGVIWDKEDRERLKTEPHGMEHLELTEPYVQIVEGVESKLLENLPIMDFDLHTPMQNVPITDTTPRRSF